MHGSDASTGGRAAAARSRRRQAVNRAVLAAFLVAIVAGLALAGCGQDPSSSPTVPTASGAGLVLRRAPDDLGCDAIGVDYRSVTFQIDPTADEHVFAITDRGALLRTFWGSGFEAGTADDPVVRDATGTIVVRDGDVMSVPEGAYPDLHGHFVCLAPDALYILDEAEPG
jgi:hypothetical protein